MAKIRSSLVVALMAAVCLQAAERPPITGIANFVVKVDRIEEARKFYNGVVGMEEAFKTRDSSGADYSCFKVNDRQYVEVSPTLKTESEDRLIRIGFETKDARKLRDYLAGKGVKVPAKVGKDANGIAVSRCRIRTGTRCSLCSTCPAPCTAGISASNWRRRGSPTT